MADQEALLRLLAAAAAQQQQLLGASVLGFGWSPEALLWQQLLAANLSSLASSAAPSRDSFDDALKRLVAKTSPATTNIATASTSKSVSPVKNGEAKTAELEPGEIPKKSRREADSALAWQMLASQMAVLNGAVAPSKGQSRDKRVEHKTPRHTNGHVAPVVAKKKSHHKKKENPLDLSRRLCEEISEETRSEGADTPSTSTSEPPRRRTPPSPSQVRLPLSRGWKRQTCVRAVTGSGVRGDVVYYAPDGKKLGSYAEVIRFLGKNPQNGLTRDHFCFSCKIGCIGEFVMIEEDQEGVKVVRKLSEEEMAEEIAKLRPRPSSEVKEVKEKKKETKKEKEKEKEKTPCEEEEPVDEEGEEREGEERDGKAKRQPVDDLLLEELRRLPTLDRVENLEMSGEAFARALQVHEFLHNFGHVLHLDSRDVPSLSELCAGLSGGAAQQPALLRLTRLLLQLVLEYPGVPSGKKSLRHMAGDLHPHRDNYSELLRLFLASRDAEGKELALLLEACSFESLDAESKARILAFMCDELLYCRNIVREIESNLEDIARMKGDKWLKEGKVRALRVVQTRKRKEREKEERQDGEDAASSTADGDEEKEAAKTKTFTPGLGQCEVLTEEEEAMEVDEMEEHIRGLNAEAEELREKAASLSERVRVVPLGQDRFHRFFWRLPSVGTPLVESVESSAASNPACNLAETCVGDPPGISGTGEYMDPDVISCLEDLVDSVVFGPEETRKKKKRRRMENSAKRGWWSVSSLEKLEQLRQSLHHRGIRERQLHRVLVRENFAAEQLEPVVTEPVEGVREKAQLEENLAARVEAAVEDLGERVLAASLHCRGWRAGEEPREDEDEDSRGGWEDPMRDVPQHSLEERRKGIASKLLDLEKNIERRYLRPHFHTGSLISADKVLGKADDKEREEKGDTGEDEADSSMRDDEETRETETVDEEVVDSREVVDEWREAVAAALTPAQLMVCVQILDSCIAWERSVMKACCQICKSQENEGRLLLCDLCDMGWHTYCFRPALEEIPEGDWFCAKCRESASGRPTCVLCLQKGGTTVSCCECFNCFHPACIPEPAPLDSRTWECPPCDKRGTRRFLREPSRAVSEESEASTTTREVTGDSSDTRQNGRLTGGAAPSTLVTPKKAQKRKAPSGEVPTDFPPSMLRELFTTMVEEMVKQPSSQAFRLPVDLVAIPLYKEVIKQPTDLQTIQKKIDEQKFPSVEDFVAEVELMFENCRIFNEDSSPIAVAADSLRKFFLRRWRQVKYNFSKRLRRLQK